MSAENSPLGAPSGILRIRETLTLVILFSKLSKFGDENFWSWLICWKQWQQNPHIWMLVVFKKNEKQTNKQKNKHNEATDTLCGKVWNLDWGNRISK